MGFDWHPGSPTFFVFRHIFYNIFNIPLPPAPIYINHLHVIEIQNWLKQNYLITFEKVNNDTVVLWSAQNLLTTFHLCCVFTLHWQQQDCWTLPECLICIMITYRLRPPSPLLGPLYCYYHNRVSVREPINKSILTKLF